MKKILITGSSGYIGSHLCKFLENHYEVHGLDINDPIVPVKQFFKFDINKQFILPENTETYDAVIHLAALVNVGESEKKPIINYITNINGTMNVMNKIPTKNFIFASTGAAEGCASAYGISKRAAEDCVRDFYKNHKPADYTIFRFYNVIGNNWGIPPTNVDGLMLNLFKAIQTGEFTIHGNDYSESKDGTCVRDYVHVLEICQSISIAIEKPSNSVESLGHGVGHTVKEIVETFKSINNLNFEIKYGPKRQGDLPISVLSSVSSYMQQNNFKIEDFLQIVDNT